MDIPYQRALFYGDTLFETIRVMDGRIPLLEAHLDRLWEGFFRAGYQHPAHWTYAFFEEKIKEVAPANARVRLTVYRTGAGLYFPRRQPMRLCDNLVGTRQ